MTADTAGIIERLRAEGWPCDDRTPEDLLRRIIQTHGTPVKRPYTGIPRWSLISRLTGHGSGYSAAMCRWAGVDPDQMMRRR